MKYNLQFFADGAEEDVNNNADNSGVENTESKPSFDDFLKDSANQSEFDKRIAKAIETSKAKWQANYQKDIENAKNEAEKLAKMNAEQKHQYEIDKRLKELEEREQTVARKELEATAKTMLTEKGLPTQLASVLDYTDADNCNKSIDAVEEAFKQAVESAVESRLKGAPAMKKAVGNNYTDEQLNDMSDEEYYAFKNKK